MKQPFNKYKYCAYPFLDEKDWITDFEVLTDGLSSEFGHAYALSDNEEKREVAKKLSKIVLDINPLIRKPNKEILSDVLNELEKIYEEYHQDFSDFYLPISNDKYSTYISTIRKPVKETIRLLVKNNYKNEDLLKTLNLLCNTLHHIYLSFTDIKEVFKSRSY